MTLAKTLVASGALVALGVAGLGLGTGASAAPMPDAGALDAGARPCHGLRGQAYLSCVHPPPLVLASPGRCRPQDRIVCLRLAHLDAGRRLPPFCEACAEEEP